MTFPLELNFNNFLFFNVEIFLKERKTTKSHLETPMPSHLANEIVFSIGEKKKKERKGEHASREVGALVQRSKD